ncbi:MAG: hypothetical protein ABI723_24540 [Bacteroidia bacterium]
MKSTNNNSRMDIAGENAYNEKPYQKSNQSDNERDPKKSAKKIYILKYINVDNSG